MCVCVCVYICVCVCNNVRTKLNKRKFLKFQFECCGVNNFTDFQNAESWDPIRTGSISNATGLFSNESESITLKTPISCCKTDGDFPEGKPLSETCATDPTEEFNNYKTVSIQ